jgi:hypothetical protein
MQFRSPFRLRLASRFSLWRHKDGLPLLRDGTIYSPLPRATRANPAAKVNTYSTRRKIIKESSLASVVGAPKLTQGKTRPNPQPNHTISTRPSHDRNNRGVTGCRTVTQAVH